MGHFSFNKNKTQTAVTNICLNCITFINLTFRMLQHTMAYRCIRICSSPRLLQFALDDLKRILLLNGYPMGTVKYHMNDVIEKHQNKPKDPVQTCKKREVLIVLPFLGYHSKHLTKQARSCINKFYGIFNVRIVFQNIRRIKSFSPYKKIN